MNKKFSLGICISLIAIASAITFVLTMSLSLNIYNEKIAGVQQREEMYVKLQELDSYVRGNYIGEIADDTLLNSVLDGYMVGIGDKYGRYQSAEEYYQTKQSDAGSFTGIGIGVAKDESGYIKVSKIYANSPAEEAGIAVGDIITAIGNTNVLEIGYEEAVKLVPVEEGKKAVITVQRDGVSKNYSLVCKEIKVISVDGKIYNNYGYVHISAFNELSAAQFTSIIDDFMSKNVSGFVFDLRGNGGGSVSVLGTMLNRLISEAVVATAQFKDGSIKPLIETDSLQSVDLPMVVLIDKHSASASELFAAALRDLKGAQLVGTTSYGKAVMQYTNSFKDGSAVTVSTAKIFSAKSDNYDGIGIAPDYMVEITIPPVQNPVTIEDSGDAQLIKAFEVITTIKQPLQAETTAE